MASCEHGSEPWSSREAGDFFFNQLLGENAHTGLEYVLLVVENAIAVAENTCVYKTEVF